MAVIPTTSVRLKEDVGATLAAAGGDVDQNDMLTFFTEEAKINMWSKYKPVVSPTLFFDWTEWRDSGYRGSNGNCGLTIPTRTTFNSFRTILESGAALWTYTPPSGETTEPLRLGDFRGYNTSAVNPIGELATDGYTDGDNDEEGDVTFSVDVSTGMDYNLEYSDILIGGSNGTPLTKFYLGIYAVKGSSYRYKTNSVPLGSNYNFTIDIPLTTGEWKVIPFFCSVRQTGTETSGTYLSANIPAKTFTIISTRDKVVFTVFGEWNSTKTRIQNITITVKNQSGSSVTLNRIGVSLYGTTGTTDNNVGSPATVYYLGSSSRTLTVPANSDVTTLSGDFANITLGDSNSNYEYYLRASGYSGDNFYSHTFDIEDPAPED